MLCDGYTLVYNVEQAQHGNIRLLKFIAFIPYISISARNHNSCIFRFWWLKQKLQRRKILKRSLMRLSNILVHAMSWWVKFRYFRQCLVRHFTKLLQLNKNVKYDLHRYLQVFSNLRYPPKAETSSDRIVFNISLNKPKPEQLWYRRLLMRKWVCSVKKCNKEHILLGKHNNWTNVLLIVKIEKWVN